YDVESAAGQYRRLMGPDRAPTSMQPTAFASVMPAVWSFQLALRSRGLGSTLTTAHRRDQPAMARILGIPEAWEQVALLPVAYTTAATSARRPAGRSRTRSSGTARPTRDDSDHVRAGHRNDRCGRRRSRRAQPARRDRTSGHAASARRARRALRRD